MEFDKSRVYTALNATDDLIGAKGYFADDLYDLEDKTIGIFTLKSINQYHFESDECDGHYNFFYLVEPAPEKWYVLQDKVSGLLHMPTKCPLAPDTCKCVCTGSLDECNKYIEEHSKPKYRPFKDCEELIKEWTTRRYGQEKYLGDHCMKLPTIWVKPKKSNTLQASMITDFSKTAVDLSYTSVSLQYLFENFTFLDGSICGVEE